MHKNEVTVPIFFSADDNYIDLLEVAIRSISDTSSGENTYDIYILNTGLSKEHIDIISSYKTSHININFTDVSKDINAINDKDALRLRDYYSKTIYYRLFIPKLFPDIKKAIYLDADVVLVDDIANLFRIDLGDNMVGGVMDEVVATDPVFREYSLKSLGLDYTHYFNSGMLLMNLDELRKVQLEETFFYLFNNFDFKTIAPDQDFLNEICKGKVTYLEAGWDKMPIPEPDFKEEDLHLIHFNMFEKPCLYHDILFENHFWKYAKKTSAYERLLQRRDNYTDQDKENDKQGRINMLTQAKEISDSPMTLQTAFAAYTKMDK